MPDSPMKAKTRPWLLNMPQKARLEALKLHDEMGETPPSRVTTSTLVDWHNRLGEIIANSESRGTA